MLVETLDKGGMEKQGCLRICQNLRDAERYLKTDYRVHCQEYQSTCVVHCRKFALSDPVDPELQHPCPHQHQSKLKDVSLKEVSLAIEGHHGSLTVPNNEKMSFTTLTVHSQTSC